jgi:endonuclease YncB( thermonuclease family)
MGCCSSTAAAADTNTNEAAHNNNLYGNNIEMTSPDNINIDIDTDISNNYGIYIPKDRKLISKFVPPIHKGVVISVYDGDTITIVCNMPWDKTTAYKFSVRIRQIDCPEMRTRNPVEKKMAKLAKQLVVDTCLNKAVYLSNISYDKYGRILADVVETETNINIGNLLVEHGLAVVYNGGTKNAPDNWETHYNAKQALLK